MKIAATIAISRLMRTGAVNSILDLILSFSMLNQSEIKKKNEAG